MSDRALKIIGKSLENRNIAVIQDLKFNDAIETYPNELVQVLINILKNAQDEFQEKTIESPSIEIKGYQNHQYQFLSVLDNAGGIPEDTIEQIFDPYFTTKTNQDGTGLGLYMSKTIIETHCKGRLEVTNETGGACFKITLPY